MGKKVELNLVESQVPIYDLSAGIISAIAQMGYDVSNITINASEANDENDYNMTVVNFSIGSIPIMKNNKLFTGDTVNIAQGTCDVSIYAVETTTENTYFIEDVITSTIVEVGDLILNSQSYNSKGLDTMFFALLKSCIVINNIVNNTVTSQA